MVACKAAKRIRAAWLYYLIYNSEVIIMKYVCDVCGWVYDEEETGVKWEDVAEDFECPLCSVGKDQFSEE